MVDDPFRRDDLDAEGSRERSDESPDGVAGATGGPNGLGRVPWVGPPWASPPSSGRFGSYTGPRIVVPTGPPPPPRPTRGGARLVAWMLLVVLLLGATAGVWSVLLHDETTGATSSPGSGHDAGAATRDAGSGVDPGSSLGADRPDTAAIVSEVDPAVVDITSNLAYGQGEAAGTGMIVSPDGEVLTNNHVIDQAIAIWAQIDGQGRRYQAKILGTDPTADVALIQLVGASGLKTVSFGDSSDVSVGEQVVAIGNALDLPGAPKVTVGTITGLDKPIVAQDSGTSLCESLSGMLQTDAKLEPGNSGGPLVDPQGQVIAMNTAAASDNSSGIVPSSGSRIGFAIPIARALSVITEIRDGSASASVHVGPSPLLGVKVAGVDDQGLGTACDTSGGSFFGPAAPVTSGALVVGVEAGTPAERAGIETGDAITSFDGHTVKTPEDLTLLVEAEKPGARVQVGWVDISGTNHTATVTLSVGPAD